MSIATQEAQWWKMPHLPLPLRVPKLSFLFMPTKPPFFFSTLPTLSLRDDLRVLTPVEAGIATGFVTVIGGAFEEDRVSIGACTG